MLSVVLMARAKLFFVGRGDMPVKGVADMAASWRRQHHRSATVEDHKS